MNKKYTPKEFVTAWQKGEDLAEIAKKCNTTVGYVRQLARKYTKKGIPLINRSYERRFLDIPELTKLALSLAKTSRKEFTIEPRKHNFPITCTSTGCKKPHKGPRFKFLCVDHRSSNGNFKVEKSKKKPLVRKPDGKFASRNKGGA